MRMKRHIDPCCSDLARINAPGREFYPFRDRVRMSKNAMYHIRHGIFMKRFWKYTDVIEDLQEISTA